MRAWVNVNPDCLRNVALASSTRPVGDSEEVENPESVVIRFGREVGHYTTSTSWKAESPEPAHFLSAPVNHPSLSSWPPVEVYP